LPLAVLNQLVIYDELISGNTLRWMDSGTTGAADIDALIAENLTPQEVRG